MVNQRTIQQLLSKSVEFARKATGSKELRRFCEGLEAARNDILKEAESRRSALLQELGKAWREGQKGRDEAMQQVTDQMRNTLVTLNIATGSDLKKLEKKLSGVTKRLRALEKAYKKELENS